jgi:hypothetical protein
VRQHVSAKVLVESSQCQACRVVLPQNMLITLAAGTEHATEFLVCVECRKAIVKALRKTEELQRELFTERKSNGNLSKANPAPDATADRGPADPSG